MSGVHQEIPNIPMSLFSMMKEGIYQYPEPKQLNATSSVRIYIVFIPIRLVIYIILKGLTKYIKTVFFSQSKRTLSVSISSKFWLTTTMVWQHRFFHTFLEDYRLIHYHYIIM